MIESGRGNSQPSPLCLSVNVSYSLDTSVQILGFGQWSGRADDIAIYKVPGKGDLGRAKPALD